MSDNLPGLYINPDGRGINIDREPGWDYVCTIDNLYGGYSGAIKLAFDLAKTTGETVFVLNPTTLAYEKIESLDTIPPWCRP